MNVILILESGNFVLFLYKELKKNGITTQVVPIPCKIAHGGCGYCLKFDISNLDTIKKIASSQQIVIKEMYKEINLFSKKKFEKL